MDKLKLGKLLAQLLPSSIEDTSEKVTEFKLMLGAAIGVLLIAGAFLTWWGFFDLVVEEFDHVEVSNATLLAAAGILIIWLTLTRVGSRRQERKKFSLFHRDDD
jgi:multisubunit Na+/H+ antiporter MnhB subunit